MGKGRGRFCFSGVDCIDVIFLLSISVLVHAFCKEKSTRALTDSLSRVKNSVSALMYPTVAH